MKLYLARHGDYVIQPPEQLDVLSTKGQNDIITMSNFLKHMNLHVFNILHSDKNRAKQTAELLAQGFISEEPPKEQRGLSPNDDVTIIVNDVTQWGDDLLLVGHMPFMSRLMSYLLLGNDKKEIVNFQTGTVVCLNQLDITHWMIDWILSPQMLIEG